MNARKIVISAGLISAVLLSSGCESMSNTAKGGLVGGGVGTGLGALAGSASGHAGKGALIGGLAGTVIGGIVGNDVDNEEKKKTEQRIAVAEARTAVQQVQHAQMGMTEVLQLSRDGVHEDVIINQIRSSGSTFQLSNEDVRFLTTNGVSPKVIVEMQNRRPVARVVREQPYVIQRSPPPVVVYESYPQPVMGAGFYTRIR